MEYEIIRVRWCKSVRVCGTSVRVCGTATDHVQTLQGKNPPPTPASGGVPHLGWVGGPHGGWGGTTPGGPHLRGAHLGGGGTNKG